MAPLPRIWILFVLKGLHVNALLISRPESAIVRYGMDVQFVCASTYSTPVDWEFHPATSQHSVMRLVFTGTLVEHLQWKYKAVQNRASTLTVFNVTSSDIGRYSCVDKAGLGPDRAHADLSVIETEPECNVNATQLDYLQAHRCGDKLDVVKVSCTIKYRGHAVPSLTWRRSTGEPVPSGNQFTEIRSSAMAINGSSVIISSMLMSSSGIADGDQFSCGFNSKQTPIGRLAGFQYKCTTPVINIKSVAALKSNEYFGCDLDWIKCDPCVLPPCEYRWIDRLQNKTIATGRWLNLTQFHGRSYTVQCELVCWIGSQTFSTFSDRVTCFGDETTGTLDYKGILAICGGLLFVLLIGFGIGFCSRRRQKIFQKRFRTSINDCLLSWSTNSQKSNSTDYIIKDSTTKRIIVQDEAPNIVGLGLLANAFEEQEYRQVEAISLELLEIVLIKASFVSYKCRMKSSPCPAKDTYECLASVCCQWCNTFNKRHWVKSQLQRRYQKFCHIRQWTNLQTSDISLVGVTYLEDNLYAVFTRSASMFVYLATPPFTSQPPIEIKQLMAPRDIVACSKHHSCYVADSNGILNVKIDKFSNKITRWLDSSTVKALSITEDDHVIVTESDKLCVYDDSGQKMFEVTILLKDLQILEHAVATVCGTFIVCYTDKEEPEIQRVSEIFKSGEVLKTYGGEREEVNRYLYGPRYAAVDSYSSRLFIADHSNHQVLLMNSKLEVQRVLLKDNQFWHRKLCFVKNSKLLVTCASNGCIQVFRVLP